MVEKGADSTARKIRLQQVRQASVGPTALLEKKHRKVYGLDGVKSIRREKRRADKSRTMTVGSNNDSGDGTTSNGQQDARRKPSLSLKESAVSEVGAARGGGSGTDNNEALQNEKALSTSESTSSSMASGYVDAVTMPIEEAVWKEKSSYTTINHRPVSRDILQPEIAKYHSHLSKKRRAELGDRVMKKVQEITDKIKRSVQADRELMVRETSIFFFISLSRPPPPLKFFFRTSSLAIATLSKDSKQVFHPLANSQRAHTQLLVKLQRSMNPDQIQEMALKEMIRDDKRDFTEDEIDEVGRRFGGMFQGTAFGGILKVKKEVEISPRAALQKELESRGVKLKDTHDGSAASSEEGGGLIHSKSIRELKSRTIMDFEEFKSQMHAGGAAGGEAGSSGVGGSRRPSTRDRRESDGFRDFQHIRSLASKSDARKGMDNKDALSFNKNGIFSGMLCVDEEAKLAPLICANVTEKLWHDSERTGRRPNYSERHNKMTGFNSQFVDRRTEEEKTGSRARWGLPGERERKRGDHRGADEEALRKQDDDGGLFGEEGEEETDNFERGGGEKYDGGSSPEMQQPRVARAANLKKTRRSSTEDPGTVMKDAQMLQKKLEECWTILEFPMIKKLHFLEKFAHNDFSMKLPAAVMLWEKAAAAVPLREKCMTLVKDLKAGVRISPKDVRENLDLEGALEGIDCTVDLPTSFLFEERVDAGKVSDEELITVAETFHLRGGEFDVYLVEVNAWLNEVLKKLDAYLENLGKEMMQCAQETITWKGT